MQGAMAGLLGREGAGSDRLQRRLGGSASLCDLCGPQKALGTVAMPVCLRAGPSRYDV